MRLSTSKIAALSVALEAVVAHPRSAWDLRQLRSIVTFGDSYTDESRLGYFGQYKTAPPVGWVAPPSNNTASGGLTWARFAAISTNANLYNYAVSGAVCSNNISPRTWSYINAPFPAVLEYEVPAFIADSKYINPENNTAFLDIPPANTVYAIWIGTNDLGNDAFLTDSQIKGKVLPDYVDCVYQALEQLYQNGGRYFVLMDLAPLNLLPQYALPENGGLPNTQFWNNKGSNLTEISYRMLESVATVNQVYQYRTPFEVKLSSRFRGAHFAHFNTNGLITDIYYNSTAYFPEGTQVNTTGYVKDCALDGSNCTYQANPERFLWYDPLHPSEVTDRIIADNFVDVINGNSRWATYWS